MTLLSKKSLIFSRYKIFPGSAFQKKKKLVKCFLNKRKHKHIRTIYSLVVLECNLWQTVAGLLRS